MSVSFLHTNTNCVASDKEWKACQAAESAKYLNDAESGLLNHRNRLTSIEETRILGQRCCIPMRQTTRCVSKVGRPPVGKDVGKQMESAVFELCSYQENILFHDSSRQFPLKNKPSSALEGDIVSELNDSWFTYQRLSAKSSQLISAGLHSKIARLQGTSSHLRSAIEYFIMEILNNSEASCVAPSGVDLKRVSRLHPTATARDCLLILVKKDILTEFCVAISENEKLLLQGYIIEWLHLCVIEDKLARLSGMIGNESGLLKELRVFRSWDPVDSPSWLVFEVEHCLQIWPEQAVIASHLIRNSGNVVQLNMGMGKTRYVLRMAYEMCYTIVDLVFLIDHICWHCFPQGNHSTANSPLGLSLQKKFINSKDKYTSSTTI
jgi:hypothetical protein